MPLSLQTLVAHFLDEPLSDHPTEPDEPRALTTLGDAPRAGVAADGDMLVFFAHPWDPGPDTAPPSRADAPGDDPPDDPTDLDLGSDNFGRWHLRHDSADGVWTVWLRVPRAGVGHAEFAAIVARLGERLTFWSRVLTLHQVRTAPPGAPSQSVEPTLFA
jgi:hypothetical protein